jgi:DNA-binding winged helix-turn-helix (wHTH) protein
VVVRFGDYSFDGETRQLFCEGHVVPLSPKAFGLLEYLIREAPRAISRDELHGVLWPHIFVSEGNLARLAAEVRRALGDSAHDPRFVRTLYGFGYSFSGDLLADRLSSARGRSIQREANEPLTARGAGRKANVRPE